jgi:hypothetical protein
MTATSRKPDDLPELPLIGNQRKWNTAKIILRSICLGFDTAAIALIIALCAGGDTYSGTALVYGIPIVSGMEAEGEKKCAQTVNRLVSCS